MDPRAGYATPLLHVADVAGSIRFYTLLGFDTIDTQGDGGHVGWARLHCEGGALMLLEAEEPLDTSGPPLTLYMYTPDLPALREHLIASGLDVSPIRRPEYMPGGEVQLRDPDGNIVLVGHWGKPEHEAWEKHLAERKR